MKLAIDGRPVEVPDGATVLDAVNALGIPLPQLCKDPDRSPLGACRTCLVQVEGQRGTPAASGLRSGSLQSWGSGMPSALTASSTVAPAGTSTGRPSIASFIANVF